MNIGVRRAGSGWRLLCQPAVAGLNNMSLHSEFDPRGLIYKHPRPVALGLNGVVHRSWRHMLRYCEEGRGPVPEVQQRLHRREEELLVPEVLRADGLVASVSGAPAVEGSGPSGKVTVEGSAPADADAARLAGSAGSASAAGSVGSV